MYTDFTDHYNTLGLSFPASEAEIKTAYRKLARENHPDLHPEQAEHYTARFQEITAAYEILSDPLKKQEYDDWYRQLVLQEPALYAYTDHEPEQESHKKTAYRHRYTVRGKVGFTTFFVLLYILFQGYRLLSGSAPIAPEQKYILHRPPTEIRELIYETTDGNQKKDTSLSPYVKQKQAPLYRSYN